MSRPNPRNQAHKQQDPSPAIDVVKGTLGALWVLAIIVVAIILGEQPPKV